MANGINDDEFIKYRDMAPEVVEDDTILELIQSNKGNHAAISAAIENMWHDLPDEKAVGVKWSDSSKKKSKKDVISAQQADRAGRGGRGRSMPPAGGRGQGAAGGRGDRPMNSGGRGGGGASASFAGRGSSVSRPAAPSQPAQNQGWNQPQTSQPTFEQPTATTPSSGSSGWGSGGVTLAEKLKQAEIQKLLPPPTPVIVTPVATIEPVIDTTPSNGDKDTTDHNRGARSKGRTGPTPTPVLEVKAKVDETIEIIEDVEELVEQISELTVAPVVVEVEEVRVETPVLPVAAVPITHTAPVSPERAREIVQIKEEHIAPQEVPEAFLKMGKWEAPLESSAFQFGSFNNFGNTNNEEISISTPAPWGGAAENVEHTQVLETTGVWSNGSSNGDASASSSSALPSQMSSLFPPNPKGLPSPADNTPSPSSSNSPYNQKPSAPPGLEQVHPHSALPKPLPRQDSRSTAPGQSRGKHEINQQQLQQQQYQQPQYQQQPPGIPPAAARGQVNAPAAMPYVYAPQGAFDLQAQYQSPYGQPAPAMAPPAAGPSQATPAGPASAPQGAIAQPQGQTQQQQGQQQQQQQYGPPPGMANPYYANPYGNPYYPNQAYFYGQPQVQNPYYNQGRDYNQAPRPYGSDPYAAGGQYPNPYQGGGFPDASGAYPGMSMQHPSMGQQQGQGAAAASPGAAGAGGQGKQKGQQGVGAPSAAPQQDPNHGYSGYNPYNRDAQSWQQYQPNPAQWGAPMMGFPGGSPTGAGGPQGFPQQQQQQPSQQQSGGQGQRPSSSYGGPAQGQGQQQGQGSFSRGPAGPSPNAGQGPSGQSAGQGQHW